MLAATKDAGNATLRPLQETLLLCEIFPVKVTCPELITFAATHPPTLDDEEVPTPLFHIPFQGASALPAALPNTLRPFAEPVQMPDAVSSAMFSALPDTIASFPSLRLVMRPFREAVPPPSQIRAFHLPLV